MDVFEKIDEDLCAIYVDMGTNQHTHLLMRGSTILNRVSRAAISHAAKRASECGLSGCHGV
jgi:hypothetical protein